MFPLREEIRGLSPEDPWPAWKAIPEPPQQDPREVDDASASEARYKLRLAKFRGDGRRWPRLRHHALWLLHNCVAHPLLALTTSDPAIELHELTSQWLNHEDRKNVRVIRVLRPKVQTRGAWILHNLVAHVAIGTLPCTATFRFHDKTAQQMGVPGWV